MGELLSSLWGFLLLTAIIIIEIIYTGRLARFHNWIIHIASSTHRIYGVVSYLNAIFEGPDRTSPWLAWCLTQYVKTRQTCESVYGRDIVFIQGSLSFDVFHHHWDTKRIWKSDIACTTTQITKLGSPTHVCIFSLRSFTRMPSSTPLVSATSKHPPGWQDSWQYQKKCS